jgi:hypothetical protein
MRIARDEEYRLGKPKDADPRGIPALKTQSIRTVSTVELNEREKVGFLSSFISFATVGIQSKK